VEGGACLLSSKKRGEKKWLDYGQGGAQHVIKKEKGTAEESEMLESTPARARKLKGGKKEQKEAFLQVRHPERRVEGGGKAPSAVEVEIEANIWEGTGKREVLFAEKEKSGSVMVKEPVR